MDSWEEELYHTDLIVEAADQIAAAEIVPKAVARGVDVMVMSVGALVDDEYRNLVYSAANEHRVKIFIPSGALCGVDGLRNAAIGGLDSAELITTMGPKSFEDVEYMSQKGYDIGSIKEKTTVFSGPAREAVKLFPRNVNVAATVSLAGLGFDKTKVTIILDPKATSNSHEIRYSGFFGTASATTYNVPEPNDPKTSELAGLSATAALRRICRNEWTGI